MKTNLTAQWAHTVGCDGFLLANFAIPMTNCHDATVQLVVSFDFCSFWWTWLLAACGPRCPMCPVSEVSNSGIRKKDQPKLEGKDETLSKSLTACCQKKSPLFMSSDKCGFAELRTEVVVSSCIFNSWNHIVMYFCSALIVTTSVSVCVYG